MQIFQNICKSSPTSLIIRYVWTNNVDQEQTGQEHQYFLLADCQISESRISLICFSMATAAEMTNGNISNADVVRCTSIISSQL